MTKTSDETAADGAPERNSETDDVDPLLTAGAKKNPLANLSREEQVARLAAMLADCDTHDAQLRPFKQCISLLEQAGIPRETVWALLFHQLEMYANGYSPPTMTNRLLRDAEKEWGADRGITTEAAASIIRGDNPSRAIKDRIAIAEKEIEAASSPTPIPAEALAYAMKRHAELRRILLLLGG